MHPYRGAVPGWRDRGNEAGLTPRSACDRMAAPPEHSSGPMHPIRIWHQSFTVPDRIAGYADLLAAHMESVALPDTEIVLHGMHPDTYRTEYPGVDIRHALFQHFHSLQFIAQAIMAEKDGFDALMAGTLPDPGLREMHSAVDIPVVSYGETAMLMACELGEKFAILNFIGEMVPLLEWDVRRAGLVERCAGVRATVVFLAVMLVVGGERSPVLVATMSLGIAAIVLGVFVELLWIMLPRVPWDVIGRA